MGIELQFCKMKSSGDQREHTEHHQTLHLKMVKINFMVCILQQLKLKKFEESP